MKEFLNKNKFLIVAIIAALIIFALNYMGTGSKNNKGDEFLKKQAIQSALFPVLGPLMKERSLQAGEVLFKPGALGVVFRAMQDLGEHGPREDLRAQLQLKIREWTQTQAELKDLHVFVVFSDEVSSEK
jgi:hypothetical protein